MKTALARTLASACVAFLAAGTVSAIASPVHAAGPRPDFQLPFACGESWHLATYGGHDDYDIDMTANSGTTNGRPILAAYAGTVSFAGWSSGGGNYVKINHGNGWETLYLHMIAAPVVSTGQTVATGQQIGNVGSTGNSSGPHLHYEQLRDGVKSEAYFNGVASGITTDGSASTGPIYVAGSPSPATNAVSNNCGTAGATQVYEAASTNGWAPLPVSGNSGSVTGAGTAAINFNGVKLLYTIKNGTVYEADSSLAWQNGNTGITGVNGTGIAAISVNGVKYIYTVINGTVYEASSANGWAPGNTGITGVSGSSIAVIHANGAKLIYTIKNGLVHEASSLNGWSNGNTGVAASAVAAVVNGTTKLIYGVNSGTVYEASSANGWAPGNTGITGVSGSSIAAIHVNGATMIYTIKNGLVHEASSLNGWANGNTGAGASTVAAMSIGADKYFYTR